MKKIALLLLLVPFFVFSQDDLLNELDELYSKWKFETICEEKAIYIHLFLQKIYNQKLALLLPFFQMKFMTGLFLIINHIHYYPIQKYATD